MWKKIVRTFTALLPVDKHRSGSCKACGACCKLVYRCPFLTRDASGTPRCRIYRFRPPACRKYPRTAYEWVTQSTCGFSFTNHHDTPPAAHPSPSNPRSTRA